VQGEPAVGNRALKTRLVFRGRLLSLYKIRLVDFPDIDTPVRQQGEIGPDLFRKACEFGLDGLVSKHRDRAYRGGHCNHIKEPNGPMIYCSDYRCGHLSIVADDADRWPD
jgi:hypothetical protein